MAGFDRSFTNDLASAVEGHPDNASASVYGGMTVSWSDDEVPGRVHTVQLDVHPDVVPVVLVPAAQLSTATARAVLPERVAHAQAALNSGRSALLVEAASRRPDLLLPATREWLHQEQRRASFPHTMGLVDRLRAHGHAAVVSGAGPSVLVLATPASVPGGACPGRHGGVARARTGNDLPRRERSTCYIEGAAGGDRRGSCDIASAALTTTKRNVPLRTPHCAALVVLSWSGSS